MTSQPHGRLGGFSVCLVSFTFIRCNNHTLSVNFHYHNTVTTVKLRDLLRNRFWRQIFAKVNLRCATRFFLLPQGKKVAYVPGAAALFEAPCASPNAPTRFVERPQKLLDDLERALAVAIRRWMVVSSRQTAGLAEWVMPSGWPLAVRKSLGQDHGRNAVPCQELYKP